MTALFLHTRRGLPLDKQFTIVSACNENYFPLAKGLYLSLMEKVPASVKLAFIDIGCSKDNVEWLSAHGIARRELDADIMRELSDEKYGHRRGQICRPFLPKLFPHAEIIAWMDPDMWVQDHNGFLEILHAAGEEVDKISISQEVHQGFIRPGHTFSQRIDGEAAIFSYSYDDAIGATLAQYATYNTGFFVMARSNPLWDYWEREVWRIYVSDYDRLKDGRYFHFGEQASMNFLLLSKSELVQPIDPLFNYLSMYSPPVRTSDNIVRTAAIPHLPIGIVHLAGGWKRRGQMYLEKGLLFDRGSYLDEADRNLLSSEEHFPR